MSTNQIDISRIESIQDLQLYLKTKSTERGFDKESIEHKFIALSEEVGELARAIRQHVGMGFSDKTSRSELEEELADVMMTLLSIANYLEVDMLKAVILKETGKNLNREWK
mgnify:CR=1 FL=1